MRGGRRPQVQFKDLEVDYKDLDSLRQFVGETGKIVPSRITGASARFQRNLAKQVKRARFRPTRRIVKCSKRVALS